jgi:Tfp pilus assembly protein PilO
MKLSRRDKRVLAAGFLIAVGIVAWSYVLSPMQRRWTKASKMLQADRDELTKLRRVADERNQYGQERQRILRLVRETPDLTASQRIVPVMINEVQGLGQECGVKITRYEPLPPKIKESYAGYSMTLAGQASLGKLVEFLYDLQEHRPALAVRRLHVVPPGEDAKTDELSIEMLLTTYAIQQTGLEEQAAARMPGDLATG